MLKRLINLFKRNDAVCMVLTEQEGAEVWVNGRDSGLRTPCLVPIRKGKGLPIRLKKAGYQDSEKTLYTRKEASYLYENMRRPEFALINGESRRTELVQGHLKLAVSN